MLHIICEEASALIMFLYSSFQVHILIFVCVQQGRLPGRCPGEANLGYDPIQAALGISNDSNKAS